MVGSAEDEFATVTSIELSKVSLSVQNMTEGLFPPSLMRVVASLGLSSRDDEPIFRGNTPFAISSLRESS